MKISIIMPVYNNEKHVQLALESVLNQSYENWELCLVNDGSTDNTKEICEELAKSEERIKFFTQENQGPSAARNRGLKMATGEYCIFIDSDDFLESSALKELSEVVKEKRYELVFYGYQQVKHTLDGKKIFLQNKTEKKEYTNNQQFKEDYMYLDSIYYTHPVWNKMYRMEKIQINQLQFPNNIFTSEDFIFNLSMYEIAEHIVILDKILYNYVSHQEGTITTSFKLEKMKSFEKTYMMAYRQMKEWHPKALNKINSDYIRDISVYINSLYSKKCSLSAAEKYQVVHDIVHKESVQQCMQEVFPMGARHKLLHTLLKNKRVRLLLLTGILAKIKRRIQ